MLLINKKTTGWYHTINNGAQIININKFTAIIDTVANTFILQLPNGSVLPNISTSVLDIILKDETGANVDETFTSVVALKTRLEALDFPAYLQVNAIQEIQAGANITVNNTNPLRPIISASGGGSGTDLAYTASPTNGIVTSSTGTDATLPLADGTNAGLLKPAKYTELENGLLPIEVATTTGVSTTYTVDRIYGSIASPETGNITASTTGAKIGVTNIIIHNNGTAPTFDSKFKKLSGSGSYVTGSINYIYCTYINSTEIIYSINQRA